MLRCDGLYVTGVVTDDSGMPFRQYLRFYEDGAVLAVSSIGTPEEVAGWCVRGGRYLSRGEYTLEGGRLTFTTNSEYEDRSDPPAGHEASVIVDYEGTVSGNALTLHSSSHFNGYEETQDYAFVACEMPL